MKKFLLLTLVLFFVLIIPKAVSAVTLTNTISVSVYPSLLAIDEKANKIYAISFPTAMSIEIIDGSMDALLTPIPVDAGENASLNGIAVNSNTGTVYVSKSTSFESRENKIFIIDGSSNMVTGEIITEPYDLSGNIVLDQTANRIYITSNNSVTGSINSVTAIDATSKAILHSLELMGGPGKKVVDSSKNRIYTINTIANEIFVLEFDTNSNKLSLIATINIEDGGGPQSIALIPAINRLFVDSLNSEFVYVINTNTNEVTEKIPGRKKNDEVDSLGVNPKTNKLYVAYKGSDFLKTSDEIVVYDATTFAIDDRIKVDSDSSAELFINQTTNKVYVATSLDNSTTPIYVLSDGSSTTSGGTTTSSGGVVLKSDFNKTLGDILTASEDLKKAQQEKLENSLNEEQRKKVSKLALLFEEIVKGMQKALSLPANACDKRLFKSVRRLVAATQALTVSLCDFRNRPACLDFINREHPIYVKFSDSNRQIQMLSEIDLNSNKISDICEKENR